ncbi:FecR family protein [Lysobacter enzymogenes]|uniref:LysM peptidoglycan-binding domain-containing protein n=1 Tax=Lysobacter enzymogenes TaxID=69 RepID=A0A3N2RHQ4_LYSEN|nr:FecR domain-containing protein [Lysobacter enzymogenes]ROU07032.1 LysM peptidoglycan-binding domain-containing protein [Lysobacter enzymogenes]
MSPIAAPAAASAPSAASPAARPRARRFVAALLALFALAGACGAVQAQDWSYRVRPGDTLWDLGAKHLKAGINWRRLQEHNGIADPYHLPPGTRMRFPIGWLRIEPAKARVIAVRGAVNWLASDRSPAQLVGEGLRLGIGSRLETGPGASATLEFADGSRMTVQDNSAVVFDELSSYGSTGMVDTRMRLQRGRASNRVIPAKGPASRYIIQTPSATSSVRGTRFRIAAGDAGAADATEVLEGKVEVGAQRGQVLVTPGYGTLAGRGDAPSAPIALLAAPQLDPAATVLDQLPARAGWNAVPGASGYRIEVVRDDAPEVLLFERSTADTRVRIDDLPPGRQRLLVRAVAGNGLGGHDLVQAFTVDAGPAPPLTLAPLDGQSVRVPKPRFEWAKVEGAAASRVQIARDADFAQPLLDETVRGQRWRPERALEPGGYFWRVASRDGDGRLGRFGNALPFQISDAPLDPGLQPPQSAKGKLTLRWQRGEPGQRYRVQMSRKTDFSQLLLEREADEPQIELDRPGGGTWHVRVQTIEDDGYAAPYGPAQEIRLPCRLCYAAGGTGALLLLLAL